MQVFDERKKATCYFRDLMVGDLFYETDDEEECLLMVTEIVVGCNNDKYNCINLETGWGWMCQDDAPVSKVRGKIVLY